MKLNLIPDHPNPSLDYYCTWQTQLYYTNGGTPEEQRRNLTEEAIFGDKPGQGWARFHEKAREDLLFVMDDSWDVPLDGNKDFYGSLRLDREKFPSFYEEGSHQDALKRLSDRIKDLGWKGLGGWVCAQEAKNEEENLSPEDYWTKRLQWANEGGMVYWKVDWGEKCWDPTFRQMLTALGRKYAPDLVIEHSMLEDLVGCSDAFRSYDVPEVMSIPMTLEKLSTFLCHDTEEGFGGVVNCEDEAYIAASLGCAMGIMRHNMVGVYPNGQPDAAFPRMHRNVKTKMAEVVRAARWHRIAPTFRVCLEETKISGERLTDRWEILDQPSEIEPWWQFKSGDTIEKSGPAMVVRGLEFPRVTPAEGDLVPFITASRHPNGAVSIATLGRTLDRKFFTPSADVTLAAGESRTFGIFGDYHSLTIETAYDLTGLRVYAQDLAADCGEDVTEQVKIEGSRLILDGQWLRRFGTSAQEKEDTSEPGLVLQVSGT